MSPGRRVAITGMGAISALGLDAGALWDGLASGRTGIRPIEGVDTSDLRFKNGAEVPGFEPRDHFSGEQLQWLDRFSQLGVVAARQAVREAGLETPLVRGERCAVVTGSAAGGSLSLERSYHELFVERRKQLRPLAIPLTMANAGASAVAADLGVAGPVLTLSTACASSSHALGTAFWMVRNGVVDLAVAGGSEAPFAWGNLKAWEAIRAVSLDTCRPFSRDRRGTILGEGAAMLVLEPLEAARARGARIWGELVGFGMSSDAGHLTRPLPEGQARAIGSALDDAGIHRERIGYVNAHGTGTQANDVTEATALRQAFGRHASRIAVSSTKSMHGHALGASGALESVATILALEHGLIPPTTNFTSLDPECDLDVVPNEARPAPIEFALSSSFGFGGVNAVLAFRRAEG
jgi:nodulation protein E